MLELRRLAQPLLDDPPFEPTPVEELLVRARRHRHRRLLAAVAGGVTVFALAVTVVAVTRPTPVMTVGPSGHVFVSRSTIPVGEATDIALGPDGVWVPGNGVVRRVDPHTNTVDVTVSVPGRGFVRSVIDAYGSVWVTDSGTGNVTRIDVRTRRVTATIPVGGTPTHILAAAGRIYLTVVGSVGEVGVSLDPATDRFVTGRPAQNGVLALASDRDALYFLYPSGVGRYGLNTQQSRTVLLDPTSRSTDYAADMALDATTLFVLLQSGRVIAYDAPTLRRLRAGPPITGAAKLATNAGNVWVLTGHPNSDASGRLWRLNARSLAVQGTPIQVRSPITITAAINTLWVAAGSDAWAGTHATLTRLNLRSQHSRG